MSELMMDRIRLNLSALRMKNTLTILENYLERAVKDELNVVEVLDHIFSEEANSKRERAYETQLKTSGFPMKKGLKSFDFSFQPSIDKRQIDELATLRFLENGENVVFLGPPGVGKTHLATALGMVAAANRRSTYYINCHQLIEQLKTAHYENRLPEKLKILGKYKLLIIDEIGYLPMDIAGANYCVPHVKTRKWKSIMNQIFPYCLKRSPAALVAGVVVRVVNPSGSALRL